MLRQKVSQEAQAGGSEGLNFSQWELRVDLKYVGRAESSEFGCQLGAGNRGEDEWKALRGFNLGNLETERNGQEESRTLWCKHASQLAVTGDQSRG